VADIANVADEIEITPEMISRGGAAAFEMLRNDPLMSPGLADDLAERVLLAVFAAPHGKIN
jgi:hypothetical protein